MQDYKEAANGRLHSREALDKDAQDGDEKRKLSDNDLALKRAQRIRKGTEDVTNAVGDLAGFSSFLHLTFALDDQCQTHQSYIWALSCNFLAA